MDSWDEMIQIMKSWIDENIEEASMSELAKRLGYSYFYSTRKFHEMEGISFREYISNRKIQKSAVDLYTTMERIVDIAVKYGYSSQEAYTRAFTRVYGITPAVYRKLPMPTASAEKSVLLDFGKPKEPFKTKGGSNMKLYVKQMFDWNCYAYYAEDVDEQYWDYFKSELWWQLGNGFIRQYDNVKDFEYCAANFEKYGEIAIKQQLKMIPAPWEEALSFLISEIKSLGVEWHVHGSAAMALWGIDVAPKDVNIAVTNFGDFEKVRERFYKLAIKPFERCENWVASGLGTIFNQATIGFSFRNDEPEPYDMTKLSKMICNGEEIYVSSLEMLKQDNDFFGRPERVKMIEEKIKSR